MSKLKVAYITRHTVSNYGSLLQAYATQTALEKLGFEPVCINYWREDEQPPHLARTLLQMSRWNKNGCTRALYRVTQKPVFDYAVKRFSRYRAGFLRTTERLYNSDRELQADCPRADVYMTGSDQVWNVIANGQTDPVYFLDFVPDDARKIAYAASFGGKSVAPADREVVAALLQRYAAVCVRENSGVQIAAGLGIRAVQVLDPTLLLDRTDWESMLPNRRPAGDYVLVYQLHPNKSFERYAVQFARRKGLKLYRVHPYFHHIVKPGKFVCCPPVQDFLWYIRHARFLLTDSFHGTALAIGLNTQFVDILPSKYSERNQSVLELTGLTDRILQSYEDFSIADQDIDFERVNRIIREERSRCLHILKGMIEGTDG